MSDATRDFDDNEFEKNVNSEPDYEYESDSEYEYEKDDDEYKYDEYKKSRSNRKTRKRGDIKSTIITVVILLLIIVGVYSFVKNLMPEYIMEQGKKNIEKGNYQKALNMFKVAANSRPQDIEPILYQVTALSKLPHDYENQKMLYEISQLDDFDEASEAAENVLNDIRKDFNRKIGSNYTDNVLFEELMLRWNVSEPVTYCIISSQNVTEDDINAIKEAFGSWSSASSGLITFKETPGNPNSNIVVNITEGKIPAAYDPDKDVIGAAVPELFDDNLRKVNIYIKPVNAKGLKIDRNNLYNVAQHEIGHALGLWGHSAYPNDVMAVENEYAHGSSSVHVISYRDINTLRALYNMVPDVTDKPLKTEEKTQMYYHPIFTSYPGENFQREIQRLIELLKNDRKNVVVWVDLATNYSMTGQYERSIYILKNILPLVGDDIQNQYIILYNIAVNYYKLKDYDNAKRYLFYAVKQDDDRETQTLDAFLDFKENKLDLAKNKLIELQKKYPDDIEIALKLAEVYFKESDKKGETKAVETLLKHNPNAIKDRRVAKYKTKSKNKQ